MSIFGVLVYAELLLGHGKIFQTPLPMLVVLAISVLLAGVSFIPKASAVRTFACCWGLVPVGVIWGMGFRPASVPTAIVL